MMKKSFDNLFSVIHLIREGNFFQYFLRRNSNICLERLKSCERQRFYPYSALSVKRCAHDTKMERVYGSPSFFDLYLSFSFIIYDELWLSNRKNMFWLQ